MDQLPTRDVLEWLVLPLGGWLVWSVHTLSVRTAEILEQLRAGADTHRRHDERLNKVETRVETHGEEIAALKVKRS